MKLYSFPLSSNARKTVMTALLVDVPVEIVNVDLGRGEQRSPEYLKLNPNGKVPTLVDGDFSLWESTAIMMYLADKKGETPVYPRDIQARADVSRWICWSHAHFTPQIGILNFENMIKKLVRAGDPDPARVKGANEELLRLGAILDAHLAKRTWLTGETLTLADVAVACPMMSSIPAKLPLGDFANLQSWYGRIRELDAWKATEPPPLG